MAEERKAHYLPPLAFWKLDRACALVNEALKDDGYGCYLVGSSLARRDFRDVDVRYIMKDEAYDRLFKVGVEYRTQLWSLMCVTIAAWLSAECGFSVDFQLQRQTEANALHEGQRNALGIDITYPGERPNKLDWWMNLKKWGEYECPECGMKAKPAVDPAEHKMIHMHKGPNDEERPVEMVKR